MSIAERLVEGDMVIDVGVEPDVASFVANVVAGGPATFHLPGRHDQKTHGRRVGVDGQKALDAAPMSLVGTSSLSPPEDMSEEEFFALRRYRGTGYKAINDGLRSGEPVGGLAGKRIEQIDSAMARSELKQKVTVYRDAGDGAWLPEEARAGDLTGLEWIDRAYMSTTVKEELARAGIGQGPASDTQRTLYLLAITLPRGTRAIAMSGLDEEAELLADRGLRYRIVADHGVDADDVRRLDVEVVSE